MTHNLLALPQRPRSSGYVNFRTRIQSQLWSWFTGIAQACLYTTVCGRSVTGSNAGRRSVAGSVDGVEYNLLRVRHHYVRHHTQPDGRGTDGMLT